MIGTRQSANPARNGAARSGTSESGAAAVEVLMAMAMALLFTLFLVNALLMLYARSVLQHAADIGARNRRSIR